MYRVCFYDLKVLFDGLISVCFGADQVETPCMQNTERTQIKEFFKKLMKKLFICIFKVRGDTLSHC